MNAPTTIDPPDQSGWTLHSWAVDPHEEDRIILVWERKARATPKKKGGKRR
jgi:hypothetical protein